ncbi:hypothetical protein [Nonomuraea sediminis]|uniref:hypothetical protein n=1 Tax=Nonomuraea sediminis TaxID=2835864 RepID=UPI001BDCA200|nr:hypothetical protein [Nonomuraea sediminis]
MRTIERWMAVGTGRFAIQQEHYIRLNWYWARALVGDDPAGIAAEAEQFLAGTLVDPPRWGVAYHHALSAEMWLGAGMPDEAGVALDRADQALDAYGHAAPKDWSCCCRRACSTLAANPPKSSESLPRRPATGPANAGLTSLPAAPRSSLPSFEGTAQRQNAMGKAIGSDSRGQISVSG